MTRVITGILLAALALPAAEVDVQALLKRVEDRYNRVKTLEVAFQETYRGGTRPRRQESGTLFLRKPGRMRWEYASPPGKLFLSDGKSVFLYLPSTNKAERLKLKESEDMRAPLAFLLGRLNFQRDFISFSAETHGPDAKVRAFPASERLPYKRVEFIVTPDAQIRRLVITGQDDSELEFTFGDEKFNQKLDEALFKFVLPPGAQLVEPTE